MTADSQQFRSELREATERPSIQRHSEDTQHLLTPEVDPSLKDDGGDLPLHAAARIVHVPAVALLLVNGADVSALKLGRRNSHGCTGTIC